MNFIKYTIIDFDGMISHWKWLVLFLWAWVYLWFMLVNHSLSLFSLVQNEIFLIVYFLCRLLFLKAALFSVPPIGEMWNKGSFVFLLSSCSFFLGSSLATCFKSIGPWLTLIRPWPGINEIEPIGVWLGCTVAQLHRKTGLRKLSWENLTCCDTLTLTNELGWGCRPRWWCDLNQQNQHFWVLFFSAFFFAQEKKRLRLR